MMRSISTKISLWGGGRGAEGWITNLADILKRRSECFLHCFLSKKLKEVRSLTSLQNLLIECSHVQIVTSDLTW